ncbi:MAG: ABC transporter ATP-binding protein [Syntrophobacteraceae bacterium]|nr:ABC transporter ATP-binding protein [Syntrophobacteraceae bacterium]
MLLDLRDLRIHFLLEHGTVRAVDGLSFALDEAQVVGMVGESGCGKSVTSLSILRLIPSPGVIAGGQVLFRGRDLLGLSEPEMQSIRGNEISMVFQEPMSSLNPVFRVQDQVAEVLELHLRMSRREALERVESLLVEVGIPSARLRMRDYPHQMSGGMRQRVMIAMALACRPALLIADEPTTALDVTIQAQILDLMQELRENRRTAILLITHDLGVIAGMAQNVLVMYTGRIVEEATARELFETPLHPYTQGLMRSMPSRSDGALKRLQAIPGTVPSLLALPAGCKFNTRCPHAFDKCCREPEPQLLLPRGGHPVRCWLYEKESVLG